MERKDIFRPYRVGDIFPIWETLRGDDRREFAAVGLDDPVVFERLITGCSHRVLTWDTEGGPVAVLGVTPGSDSGVGHVWAISSEAALPRWRVAVRNTGPILKALSFGYDIITNFKDSRNQTQIAWLRRLGFTFISTQANYGGSGVPFHQFVRIVQ